MILFFMANLIRSIVLFRLSFCIMWFLWVSTVLTLMKSESAISWFEWLSPHIFRISICRELREESISLTGIRHSGCWYTCWAKVRNHCWNNHDHSQRIYIALQDRWYPTLYQGNPLLRLSSWTISSVVVPEIIKILMRGKLIESWTIRFVVFTEASLIPSNNTLTWFCFSFSWRLALSSQVTTTSISLTAWRSLVKPSSDSRCSLYMPTLIIVSV